MRIATNSLAPTSNLFLQKNNKSQKKLGFRLITIPKTGTHLIESVLVELGYPTSKMGPPHHIFYSKKLDFKSLDPNRGFIASIRDPRDIMISLVHFIDKIYKKALEGKHTYGSWTSRDPSHIKDWLFKMSFDDKLTQVIKGGKSKFADFSWVIGKQFQETSRLLKINPLPKNIICVRFEDLVGPNGGGDLESQIQTIEKIASHLNISISRDRAQKIGEKIWGHSNTFRSGQIAQWESIFKPEHVDNFKKKWNKYLLEFGYEDSENWSLDDHKKFSFEKIDSHSNAI